MSWSKLAQDRLSEGQDVTVRPSGHSMTGVINHRDEVVLAPIEPDRICIGDAVLVRVAGQVFLHLVKAIDTPKRRAQIGNNRGGVNGWASLDKVYGVAVCIAGTPTQAASRATAPSTDAHPDRDA
ncbi:MAG: S26 family signal peptidase [Deltaproteobacteria bacterium]|jgi:hypothetical protein